MDYYIFRHAQTHFSKFDIPYGEHIESAEILSEGIPAIEKLAEKLKEIPTSANFTSPYKRCLQTTNIIQEITGKKFEIDNRLHDFNAESIEDMVKRLTNFLDEINSKNYKSVAICTHGYPIATLKSLIAKGKFNLKDLNSYPEAGVLLTIKKGKIEFTDFN